MSSYELVNGYVCHNCTDVGYAKRNIDPQHPKDGPFGANKDVSSDRGPAVLLGGSLKKPDHAPAPDSANAVEAVTPANGASAPSQTPTDRPRVLDLTI